MNFKERYERLMSGNFVDFRLMEVMKILVNMNDIKINTLSVQKSIEDVYVCKVDDLTIRAFKKERNNE